MFAKAPGVFMSAGSELGEKVLLPACVSYIKGENLPQKRVTSLCNCGGFKLKESGIDLFIKAPGKLK